MGGSNKEHTLIDSIRNGDSQTAVKILQNSMINSTNKTNQSFLKSRLLNHKLVKHADLASSSLTSITSSSSNFKKKENFNLIYQFFFVCDSLKLNSRSTRK